MNSHKYRHLAPWLACSACIFFFLAGCAFVTHLGPEDDETIVAQAIFQPRAELFSLHLRHHAVPIMFMSYLGALKAWIYVPVFRVFGTGVAALRVPMLAAGAASIWLFFLLLSRIAGRRAALIGCGLLAVDSTYLLTVCFDWGPVALQHLLLLGGALMVVKFYQELRLWALAAGFFLFGLALWDKALAVWILSGMAIAGILTLRRQILAMITPRRVAVAALAFALGALPLIIYNAKSHWATFRGNFQRDTHELRGKARMLEESVAGAALFGWLTDEDWHTPVPHPPQTALARASARISALAGKPRHSLLVYGFCLSLLLLPLAGSLARRAIVFGTITLAVAWIQMAITANAGGSVHHTVLLWPLPHLVIAVSLAAASRRLGRAGIPALALLLALMLGSSLLVMNEYHVMTLRDGGGQSWTDAIFRLSDYVETLPAKYVFTMDWGIMDQLRLLNAGRLPLAGGSDQVSKPQMTEEDRRIVQGMISDPSDVFISHTKEFEYFPGANPKLMEFAAAAGYQRHILAIIADTYGRQVFEVYRFEK